MKTRSTMRIAALLPSATEIVCGLALRSRLVGVSHECDHPTSVKKLPTVTAALADAPPGSLSILAAGCGEPEGAQLRYALHMDVLERVRPSLIVTQTLGEEAIDDEVETALRSLASRPRVINLPAAALEDVLETTARVGTAAGKPYQARRVVTRLKRRIAATRQRSDAVPRAARPRVAVLKWLDPPRNGGWWVPEMVGFAGGVDCLGEPFASPTRLDWETIGATEPDVVLVSLNGLKAAASRKALGVVKNSRAWQALPAVRAGRVHIVDGAAYFSRPGPRLVDGLEWLAHLLHPRVHPPASGPASPTAPSSAT